MKSRFPNAPAQIAALPVDARGYPVPAFVPWINGEPEFRAVRPETMEKAHRQGTCWVCGLPFVGTIKAFVIGPMCAVNRIAPEPPSHWECAAFAAESCPFLTRPMAKRRKADLPAGHGPAAGNMIERNPGVCLVWLTRSYRTLRQPGGGFLCQVGPPIGVRWYAEGRAATRAEIMASIESGLPLLEEEAAREGRKAVALLEKMAARAMKLVPA